MRKRITTKQLISFQNSSVLAIFFTQSVGLENCFISWQLEEIFTQCFLTLQFYIFCFICFWKYIWVCDYNEKEIYILFLSRCLFFCQKSKLPEEKKCRMNLVYSEVKFVPKNEKKNQELKLKNITFSCQKALCKMNVLM